MSDKLQFVVVLLSVCSKYFGRLIKSELLVFDDRQTEVYRTFSYQSETASRISVLFSDQFKGKSQRLNHF